jgi:hypothetical protein
MGVHQMSDGLKEKIEALIPKGLDDIIRLNREHCQIRHATEDDLKPLLGEVKEAYPKLVITRWHLVTISISTGEQKTVLLGDICDGSGNTWVTSKIVKLDLESGYLRTTSGSLYLMAEKGEGEPSFEQLALLCSYFNRGGYGAFFGVPEFF